MRITIIVNHPAKHDGRVLKTAESLMAMGNEVTVIHRAGLGSSELKTRDGLTFIAVPYLSPTQFLRSIFGLSREPRLQMNGAGSIEQLAVLPSGLQWVKRLFGKHLRDFWIHLECKYATKSAITSHRPDIIHANDLETLSAAIWAKKSTGGKVVYDAHEIAVEEYPGMPFGSQWWRSFQERRLIKRTDAVLTIGEETAHFLSKRYGLNDIGIIYNSPDAIGMTSQGGLHKACGLSKDVPLAVFTGYLRADRGLVEILQAISLISELHFARVGPSKADLDDEFCALANKFGINARVHNIEAVDPMQTATFIQDADVALIVNRNFSTNVDLALPNKLFDALLANVPLVVGRQSAVARVVQEEGVGVIVDEEDPSSIADGIRRVISQSEFYRLDEDARRGVSDRYGWAAQVKAIEQIYARLFQERPK